MNKWIYGGLIMALLISCTTTYNIDGSGMGSIYFVPDTKVEVVRTMNEKDNNSTSTTDASKAISEVESIVKDEMKVNNSQHETSVDIDTKLK